MQNVLGSVMMSGVSGAAVWAHQTVGSSREGPLPCSEHWHVNIVSDRSLLEKKSWSAFFGFCSEDWVYIALLMIAFLVPNIALCGLRSGK